MSNLYDCGSILAELGINSATVKAMRRGVKRACYRAIINWLTKYKPNTDASNLKKVKGLLEAFYHLCEVEEWERVSKLFIFPFVIQDDIITANGFHDQFENTFNQIIQPGYRSKTG